MVSKPAPFGSMLVRIAPLGRDWWPNRGNFAPSRAAEMDVQWLPFSSQKEIPVKILRKDRD